MRSSSWTRFSVFAATALRSAGVAVVAVALGCGLAACGGGDGPPTSRYWTWVGGLAAGAGTPAPAGDYGTRGVASTSNLPGDRRYGAAQWVDANGNFWFFGGAGADAVGFGVDMNDLWKVNPSDGSWTWVSGSNRAGAPSVHGVQGIGAASNVPGARRHAAAWRDRSGDLWLFGGAGFDRDGNFGWLNDLWKFSIASGTWAWMSGSQQRDADGVYGTKGVSAAGNTPGARSGAAAWTDAAGNLWLFGGEGRPRIDPLDFTRAFSDLWRYDPTSGTWTWISGSNEGNVFATYGTRGVPSAGNTPGGIAEAAAWADVSGQLWLFGGGAVRGARAKSLQATNLLWKYAPGADTWTWVSGAVGNDAGVYGTRGVASASNMPGARGGMAAWRDASGRFWLFGGMGVAGPRIDPTVSNGGLLDDLWMFDPALSMWTWIGGSDAPNAAVSYGSKGVADSDNTPGARSGAPHWIDGSGQLWLFGGQQPPNGLGTSGRDLWVFKP